MSLVDSLKVARLVSSRAAVAGPGSLLHVVRPLNPHLALTPELRRASGLWRARVVAWDVRSKLQVFVVEAAAIQPAVLGRAVAESLVVALGRPHPGSVDPQASEAGLRASSTER